MSAERFVSQSDRPLRITVEARSRSEAIEKAEIAAGLYYRHDQFSLSMLPFPVTSEWEETTNAAGEALVHSATFTVSFEANVEVPF